MIQDSKSHSWTVIIATPPRTCWRGCCLFESHGMSCSATRFTCVNAVNHRVASLVDQSCYLNLSHQPRWLNDSGLGRSFRAHFTGSNIKRGASQSILSYGSLPNFEWTQLPAAQAQLCWMLLLLLTEESWRFRPALNLYPCLITFHCLKRVLISQELCLFTFVISSKFWMTVSSRMMEMSLVKELNNQKLCTSRLLHLKSSHQETFPCHCFINPTQTKRQPKHIYVQNYFRTVWLCVFHLVVVENMAVWFGNYNV